MMWLVSTNILLEIPSILSAYPRWESLKAMVGWVFYMPTGSVCLENHHLREPASHRQNNSAIALFLSFASLFYTRLSKTKNSLLDITNLWGRRIDF